MDSSPTLRARAGPPPCVMHFLLRRRRKGEKIEFRDSRNLPEVIQPSPCDSTRSDRARYRLHYALAKCQASHSPNAPYQHSWYIFSTPRIVSGLSIAGALSRDAVHNFLISDRCILRSSPPRWPIGGGGCRDNDEE
ncbi:hypothetical protein EVAR_2615_1 [Eumeta japonica]|uniref:Uncharacterized protein n=1 Tax=Eumeta variegata TaxID=151549 RepID=A0A4C1SMH1_EUMVA|nr:hypothetical protein EVAR_2615_1 [Eumeta japonica]